MKPSDIVSCGILRFVNVFTINFFPEVRGLAIWSPDLWAICCQDIAKMAGQRSPALSFLGVFVQLTVALSYPDGKVCQLENLGEFWNI